MRHVDGIYGGVAPGAKLAFADLKNEERGRLIVPNANALYGPGMYGRLFNVHMHVMRYHRSAYCE